MNVSWRLCQNEASVRSKFISPLPRVLADIYPEGTHVREINLRDATDTQIWEYAKTNGFVIVSKDSDFQARSLLYGSPPKFIWLRVGNCPVKTIEIDSGTFYSDLYFRPGRNTIPFDVALAIPAMLDSAVRLGDLARLPETYLGRSFSQLPNHAAMGSRAHVKQNAASSISSELYDRCVATHESPSRNL